MSSNKMPNRQIKCRLCKSMTWVSHDRVKTLDTELCIGDTRYQVHMTTFDCPCCGKTYPVLLDDESTMKMAKSIVDLYAKMHKYKQPPEKMHLKAQMLNRKLDFKRQNLAKKFEGALYQFEGDTIQLDYCYQAQ